MPLPGRGRPPIVSAPPPRFVALLATLLFALAAALLLRGLHAPLPWLIGPLLVTAARGVAGRPVQGSMRLLKAGQWAIGCALGLYFTPEVTRVLASLAPAVLAGVVWALLLGHGFYRWLWWLNRGRAGIDRATAYFSSAIGGASEMAMLAQRHGARVDRVAAAHSLRVLIVVVLIPFGMQWAGVHGMDAALPAVGVVDPLRLAVLVAATAAAGLVVRRFGLPNPWLLGALAVSMLLTASGVRLSALPAGVTAAGQLFIGVALGARFTPDFLHVAPRWLATVAIGTLGMVVLSIAFAAAIAQGTGLHVATAVLATSPGGIAEMCLTAQALQLGVPVVTAFHVVRYVAVLLLTAPLFRAFVREPAAASGDRAA